MANLGHVFTGRCGGTRVSPFVSFLSRPDMSQGWTRGHGGPLSVLRQSTTLTQQRKPACLGEQTKVSTSTCTPPRRHAGPPSLLAKADLAYWDYILKAHLAASRQGSYCLMIARDKPWCPQDGLSGKAWERKDAGGGGEPWCRPWGRNTGPHC